jgi:hypothetical protein
MNFLPFENLVILTPHQPAEVEAILQKAVMPSRFNYENWVFYNKREPLFIGDVFDLQFRFEPPHSPRATMVPIAKGGIAPHLQGSKISLKIFPSMIIFMVIGVLFCWEMAFIFISRTIKDNFSYWLPFVAPILAYLLLIVFYKYEASGVKSSLLKLLDGKFA